MKDRGSAVLSGVINIAMATLVTLSVLGLGMAGYYSLVIRDAAIDAASQGARYGAPSQREFLLKRLDISIPELAQFEMHQQKTDELTSVRVKFSLPGLGMLGDLVGGEISVSAATERL